MTSRISALEITDDYIDYLSNAEHLLQNQRSDSEEYSRIVMRDSLYHSLTKLSSCDAIVKALEIASRPSFWNKATHREDALRAYSHIMERAKALLEVKRDTTIAEAMRAAEENKKRYVFHPRMQLTVEQERERLTRLMAEISQLCDYSKFCEHAEQVLQTYEEAIAAGADSDSFSFEMAWYKKNGVFPNQFLTNYINIYASEWRKLHGIVINSDKARKVIKDVNLYELHRMRELYNFISGRRSGIMLMGEQEKLCYVKAQTLLDKMLDNPRTANGIGEDEPLVIALLLAGKLNIPKEYDSCKALLHYVDVPMTMKETSLYDTDDRLYDFAAGLIGQSNLYILLCDLIKEKYNQINPRTYGSWVTYMIHAKNKTALQIITHYALDCKHELWSEWIRQLVVEGSQNEILMQYAEADSANIELLIELSEDLQADKNHHLWIRKQLEPILYNMEAPYQRRALALLWKLGSIPALEFLIKNLHLLNAASTYEFNYYQAESIHSLTILYNSALANNVFITTLNSILKSLSIIALSSKDNFDAVCKDVSENISTFGPNTISTAKWISRLHDDYLLRMQQMKTVTEALLYITANVQLEYVTAT